jgi:hypothetical protein
MIIRTLPNDSSVTVTELLLSYAVRRTGAERDTVTLHNEAKAALVTLRADKTAERDAAEGRMAERAVLGSKSHDLYAALGDLSRWCLAHLKNDRSDSRYLHAFPKPVSEVLGGVINDEKLNYCHVAIDNVRAEASFSSLAPYIDAAQAMLDEVKAAQATVAAAEVAEAAAEATLNRSLHNARTVYNALFPKLTVIFPNRKVFVNTFFLDRAKDA